MKRAIYQVVVAGQDISSRLLPLLTSLRITDSEGTHSDTASFDVDDTSGAIVLPRAGDPIAISLGWEGEFMAAVFVGTVDEVRFSMSRDAGRSLSVSAKGVDTLGKAKEAQQLHVDDASLPDALKKAGKAAGITDIRVDGELASITRPWWGMVDESFLHFGERVAREVGGIFKISGNRAVMAKKGSGSVSGAAMATIIAVTAVNLIDLDIEPHVGRPRYKRVRSRFYDAKAAKWKTVEAGVEGEDQSDATLGDRQPRADEADATRTAEAGAAEVARERGGGSATIDGDATAKPGGTCIVVGARPGVDGAYRIESVEHEYSRSGWTTRLQLKQPQDGAGTDARGAA
jgi:phage protein D